MDSESAAAVPPNSPARRPIGEFLVERGLVTPDELAAALAQQRLSGQRLGEILVERGAITRMSLASVLGEQWEEAGRHLRAVVPVRLADGKEADTGLAGGLELTESLAALQIAVARLEDLAGEVGSERPSATESSVAADVLVRMERLEARIDDSLGGAELSAAVEAVRRDLAEVRAVLAEPVTADESLTERLGRIEDVLERSEASADQRLAAIDEWLRGRDDDALGESVTAALGELRTRIEGLETAFETPGKRLKRIEALIEEQATAAPDPAVPQALDELRAGLHELRSAVEAPSVPDEAVHARLERIEDALGQLPTGDSSADALAELRQAVEAAAAPDTAVADALAELRSGLADLRAAVDHQPSPDAGLQEQLAGIQATLTDRQHDERLSSAIDELRELVARPQDADPRLVDALTELRSGLDGVRSTVEHSAQPDSTLIDSVAELRHRLDEVHAAADRHPEPDAALLERLGGIEALLAERPADESAEALSRLRDDVRALGVPDPRLDELQAGLEGLRAAVDREPQAGEALVGRLERIEALLAERPADESAEALSRLRDDVRALAVPDPRLDELQAGLEGLRAAVDREPQADPILFDALLELRAAVDRLHPGDAAEGGDPAVLEALSTLRAAVERGPSADDALHGKLDRIEAALAERPADASADALARLQDDVRALAAPDARLDELLAAVHELRTADERPLEHDSALVSRLEAIEAALTDPAGSQHVAEQLAELRSALASHSGPDEELRERLARVEELLADSRTGDGASEQLAEVRAAVERLLADHDGLETASALSTVGDRLVELRAAVERPDETLAELRHHLDRIDATLAAPRDDGLGERLLGLAATLDELRDLARRPAEPDPDLQARLERIETLAAAHATHDPDAAVDRLAAQLREELRDVARPGDGSEATARVLDAIAALHADLPVLAPAAPDAGDIARQVGDLLGERLAGLEQSMRDALGTAQGTPDAEDIAGRVSATLADRFESLHAALADRSDDGLADRLDRIGAELRNALEAAVPAAPAVDPDEVAGRVHDAIAERLQALETAVQDRAAADALGGRLEELATDLRNRIDASAPAVPGAGEIAGRVHDALTSRFEALETAVHDRSSDDGLSERFDRLSAELAQRIDAAAPTVPDAGEIAGQMHEMLAGSLEGLEAAVRERPELELIASLAGRVDELRAAVDRDRDGDLAEQLGRIESELRAGLPPVGVAVGAHAQQLEWLASSVTRLDEDLLARLEQLLERLGGVESAVREQPADPAIAALAERIERLSSGLEQPRDADVREQLDRLETSLQSLPDAARSAVAGQEASLQQLGDALARIEAAVGDRVDGERLERLDELAGELRAALADPPGAASLTKLVTQSHNALAERITVFEQSFPSGGVALAEATPVPSGTNGAADDDARRPPPSFVALVPSPDGYRLVVLDGLLPDPGMTVEVEGFERVVARHGRSPLPGDRRRCAFLEAA